MKTPKRHHELTTMEHISTEQVWDYSQEQVNSQRWKRKNRIKKYKNTISLLRYRLKDTEDCLKITQKSTKFFLVRPDHWHPMDENGEQLTRKQWKKKNTEKEQV